MDARLIRDRQAELLDATSVLTTASTMISSLVLALSVALAPQVGTSLARMTAIIVPIEPSRKVVTLTSSETGVAFDIDADGDLDQVAWTPAGAPVAFLARDVDGDGRISSGKELFGNVTTENVHNGFAALIQVFKQTGTRLGGAIERGDRLYDELLLWVDENHNGVSETGELQHAKELFTAIGLGYRSLHRRDEHGNEFRFLGWAERRTRGPEQGPAKDPEGARQRGRECYEVMLVARTIPRR